MFGDQYEAPNVVVGAIWMLTNTLASSVAIVMQKMIINAKIPIEVVNAAMTGIGAFWLLIVGLMYGTAKIFGRYLPMVYTPCSSARSFRAR